MGLNLVPIGLTNSHISDISMCGFKATFGNGWKKKIFLSFWAHILALSFIRRTLSNFYTTRFYWNIVKLSFARRIEICNQILLSTLWCVGRSNKIQGKNPRSNSQLPLIRERTTYPNSD